MHDLVVERVCKRFGPTSAQATVAADDLSLMLRRGEFLTILGPSGCGKTTLLRLIAGLETPDSGEIACEGRSFTGLSPHQRNVFLAGQDSALYPHLTIRDNLLFGLGERRAAALARRRGVWLGWKHRWRSLVAGTSAATARRLERAADRWDCRDFWMRRPEALSAGQRQRASVARAALRRSKICLWDEPLAHLDSPLRIELRRQIRRLHDEINSYTLCVTHDAAEAFAVGDRVAVMRAGRLEQLAAPVEIYRRPASRFVAEFAAVWGMNFLALDGVELAAALGENGGAAASGLVVGVRPEAARWTATELHKERPLSVQTDAETGRRSAIGVVESVESAGAWCVVQVRFLRPERKDSPSAKAIWSVVMQSHSLPPIGARVEVAWSIAEEHRFDATTGLRVG